MPYRPPSIGSTRTMIYRPPTRILEDGCFACNGSLTWCESLGTDDCCSLCDHTKTAPANAHTNH